MIQSWEKNQPKDTGAARLRLKGEEVLVKARFPDTVYPVIQSHPVTGRKVLHFPKLWVTGVLELPGEAGGGPDGRGPGPYPPAEIRTYWHHYQVGDAIIWDNWRMSHAAYGMKNRYARTLWAMTLQARPGIRPAGGQPGGVTQPPLFLPLSGGGVAGGDGGGFHSDIRRCEPLRRVMLAPFASGNPPRQLR